MGRTKKRKSSDLVNTEKSPKPKRSKNRTKRYGNDKIDQNWDAIFDTEGNETNISINTRSEEKAQGIDNSQDNSGTMFDRSSSLSVEGILPMLANISTTVKFLTDKMNNLSSDMRHMQNSTKFQNNDQEVTADEMPQLRKFESYELPIQDQNRLEHLEKTLRIDKSFYVFFVSAFRIDIII